MIDFYQSKEQEALRLWCPPGKPMADGTRTNCELRCQIIYSRVMLILVCLRRFLAARKSALTAQNSMVSIAPSLRWWSSALISYVTIWWDYHSSTTCGILMSTRRESRMNSLGSLLPQEESEKLARRELAFFSFNYLLLIPLILLVIHDGGRDQWFILHALSRLWVHSLYQEEVLYIK